MPDIPIDKVLSIAQKERASVEPIACLFCAEAYPPHALINHMFTFHSFVAGKPDNMVFVPELVEKLREKLESLVCVCCEKTFKDRATLHAHMKKKRHMRLPREGSEYDRFFIVQYLDEATRAERLRLAPATAMQSSYYADDPAWEDDDASRSEVSGVADDEVHDEDDWSDEVDDETACILCESVLSGVAVALRHCQEEHGLDLKQVCADAKCSFYERMRLVNYARAQLRQHACAFCGKECGDAESFAAHVRDADHDHFVDGLRSARAAGDSFLTQEQWLQPAREGDPLLFLMLDGEEDELDSDDDDDEVDPGLLAEAEARRASLRVRLGNELGA
jgi:hypothetical protein